MDEWNAQLYSDLMLLCQQNDAFYFNDRSIFGHNFRMLNYRIASYTDFCNRNALECRGHMFEIDKRDNAIRLASLPLKKFFNLNENPMTMNLDYHNIVGATIKEDGSLISTYMVDGSVYFKTKMSLTSDQVEQVYAYFLDGAHNSYLSQIKTFVEENNATINFEWTSPENRVVVGYEQSNLVVIGARRHSDGYNFTRKEISQYSELNAHFVKVVDMTNPQDVIDSVDELRNAEGYVIDFCNGLHVKLKSDDYLVKHHAKDSINSNHALWDLVVAGAHDDARALFADDMLALKRIDSMEIKVQEIFSTLKNSVDTFFAANKHLTRKDYAILGQKTFAASRGVFGLVMNLYLDKDIDFKDFLRKQWREYVDG